MLQQGVEVLPEEGLGELGVRVLVARVPTATRTPIVTMMTSVVLRLVSAAWAWVVPLPLLALRPPLPSPLRPNLRLLMTVTATMAPLVLRRLIKAPTNNRTVLVQLHTAHFFFKLTL
mmetsp:Transcript_38837/g.97284  ORF Transcript_38837/g.97284 Transcript_38837/m.97284 type:complete len:117 (+) Transcript_38837:1839-2189(+)